MLRCIAGLLTVILVALGHQAQAQLQDEYSLRFGWVMPNQIDNVTEVMSQYGFGYAIGSDKYLGDFQILNLNASGVSWSTLALGFRGQFSPFDQFLATIGTGFDVSWYIPENQSSRKTDFGVHVTVGGMMYIAESFWAGTELRFLGGPGTSLYLGFTATLRAKGK